MRRERKFHWDKVDRLLNGKVYSIVTEQLGTLTKAYNTEGEEVYDRNSTNSEQIRIHSSSKDSTTTTRRNWPTIDATANRLS